MGQSYAVTAIESGLAPLATPEIAEDGLLLLTPPHFRWDPHLLALGLPVPDRPKRETLASLRTPLPHIQVAATAARR